MKETRETYRREAFSKSQRSQSPSMKHKPSRDSRSVSSQRSGEERGSSRQRRRSTSRGRSRSPPRAESGSMTSRQCDNFSRNTAVRRSKSPNRSPRRFSSYRNKSRSRSRGRSPGLSPNRQRPYRGSRSPRGPRGFSNTRNNKGNERDYRRERIEAHSQDKRDSLPARDWPSREARPRDSSPNFNIPIRQSEPNARELNTHAPSPPQDEDEPKKEKPNFGLSGLLTAETNTFNGVVVKYNEPPEAIKPTSRWRWYAFKGEEQIDILHLHRQSAYLIGKDRKVADIPLDHASISKQHAVIQYRKVVENNPTTGQPRPVVKPYIIDLESSNGTFVNSEKIPPSRYFELKTKDVIKFAFSTREYVFIQED